MAENILEKYCEELLKDEPKIEIGIKNYLSLLLAKEQLKQTNTLQLEQILIIIRLISKTINSVTLIEQVQWAEEHSQNENESGIEQIEKLGKYKATYYLTNKILSQNLKITKVFGKLFFKYSDTWRTIHNTLLSNKPETIEQQFYEEIITNFHHSIITESSTQTDTTLTEEIPFSIIWSKDLNSELAKRQNLRAQQAKEREVNYQQQLASEIERLRTNIQTHNNNNNNDDNDSEDSEDNDDDDDDDQKPRVEYLDT